ncbi:hypothetical protein LXL04_021047 [Taraxacum kok-saghyz]
MEGKTYVTNGNSTYKGIPFPSQGGGYGHGPKIPSNQYVIETKSIERVRAPDPWSTDFVGSPSKIELLNEYVHSPTMSSSPNPNYGLNYENSSPPKFHNEGSWPVKNSNFSGPNKYPLETVDHSPRSDPRQRGVLDELSTRAQPQDPQKRYARPAFVGKPNYVYNKRY